MTAYRFVTLTCDGCGEIHDDGRSVTVPAARVSAAREGWRHRRGVGPHETGPGPGKHLDLCGVCSGTHERTPHGVMRKENPRG